MRDMLKEVRERLQTFAGKSNENARTAGIFDCFSMWCGRSKKLVVLMIDEVDTATDNQVLPDFLMRLGMAYLDNDVIPAFQLL